MTQQVVYDINKQIDRFKENISSYNNYTGTCWNLVITNILLHGDKTRDATIENILFRGYDYRIGLQRPHALFEGRNILECIREKSNRLVEESDRLYGDNMICLDTLLPLDKNSPYYPFYKHKKIELIKKIIEIFMIRVNNKCVQFIVEQDGEVKQKIELTMKTKLPGLLPELVRAQSINMEDKIGDLIYEFLDMTKSTDHGLPPLSQIMILNLLSLIFINKFFYYVPFYFKDIQYSHNAQQKLKQMKIPFKKQNIFFNKDEIVGLQVRVPGHVIGVFPYKGKWKFIDNEYTLDFKFEEFINDMETKDRKFYYLEPQGIHSEDITGNIINYSGKYNIAYKKNRFEITNINMIFEFNKDEKQFRKITSFLTHDNNIHFGDMQADNKLFSAIRENYSIDIIEEIIKQGVNIDSQFIDTNIDMNGNITLFENGITPLLFAIKKGKLEVVKLLLDYGANPTIECCTGSDFNLSKYDPKIKEDVQNRIRDIKAKIIPDKLQQLLSNNWHVKYLKYKNKYLELKKLKEQLMK
jgi:hypothetical protein